MGSGPFKDDTSRPLNKCLVTGNAKFRSDIQELDIPVVKCLVPGLEIMTVLDRFSPLNIRQFGHYLKAYS